MSTGQLGRKRSASQGSSKLANRQALQAPAPSITPKNDEVTMEPCAATASFFLYAQRNVVLCLHHDTLAIERRFSGHREDVLWIHTDNVSDRGNGRLVVSYDSGNTAIVWDLFTGAELSRFASYENIQVAAWLKNSNVAFGNSQGNVILYEPQTSEHISARTIFDPITALAPCPDCRTFAIGYQNGSILIVHLQPSFTILHTLTTHKAPSPIAGLAWHGSSSKQKSEMLAAQARDGDLRVWSVPKGSSADPPCVIRLLGKNDNREPGPVWFAWSKMGRIIQFTEGQTTSWDVRTKRVTNERIPTIEGVVGMANFGSTASLFTMGQNHTVQQYDINPNGTPSLVASVQHVLANLPPSPPNSVEAPGIPKQPNPQTDPESTDDSAEESSGTSTGAAPSLPLYLDSGSSEGEGVAMSPLQKIAHEMDMLEEESRDRVGPLSPVSSRASISSRSSGGSRRYNSYRLDRPSSRNSSKSGDGTVFSFGASSSLQSRDTGRESISIRSVSSAASSSSKRRGSSSLRQEILRSPDEAKAEVDLFPFLKARLSGVAFRTPEYSAERTPDDLRQQMLSVVFGWDGDIEDLIRDELSRHRPGSASAVLISKWLGDLGADLMASMVGSQSMTSSDWMLLALSSMGQDSQKKVGEAFVQRLLEKGDIHPAVAILLGLGEQNDAVEVYVSRKYFPEAVLLTCLTFPTDWKRISFLVRKWGELAVGQKQPELAVRCFSCTSIESSEPWFSPQAQDAVFQAQKQSVLGALSPPLSPPFATVPNRLTAKNASLRLITTFGEHASSKNISATDEQTPMNIGVTPIAESALSPSGAHGWTRPSSRMRDPSSARTATPGGYGRKRFPSKSGLDRVTNADRSATPQTAIASSKSELEVPTGHGRAKSQDMTDEPVLLSAVTYDPSRPGSAKPWDREPLPSPAPGVFDASQTRPRNVSRDRKPSDLHLTLSERVKETGTRGELSPPLTNQSMNSLKSAKIRSINQYISSLDEANHHSQVAAAQQQRRERAESRKRAESKESKSRTRHNRDVSESRGSVKYIKPAKRSPSSPISMSPDDGNLFASNSDAYDDERYYRVASPVESRKGRPRSRSRPRTGTSKPRGTSKSSRRAESPEQKPRSRAVSGVRSRHQSRPTSPDGSPANLEDRGRSVMAEGSHARSPSSPLPMSSELRHYREESPEMRDGSGSDRPLGSRDRSTSRKPRERGVSTGRRDESVDRVRARSQSRRRARDQSATRESQQPAERASSRQSSRAGLPKLRTDMHSARLTRKELAARELEERRLSLARRPSAPVIPHPGELSAGRPPLSGRSLTDDAISPLLSSSAYSDRIRRSQTVDPEAMMRFNPKSNTGTSTFSMPIGLPATPRAMRHPRYMSADPNEREGIPAVPQIPANLSLAAAAMKRRDEDEADDVPPLLPSTVYGGQKHSPILARAASAPPEKMNSLPAARRAGERRGSLSRNHVQKSPHPDTARYSGGLTHISPPVTASIDETLHDSHVVIIEDHEERPPPLLAELQHLAGAPPPPPPGPIFPASHNGNGSLGVINIAIDEQPQGEHLAVIEVPPPPPQTASPTMHRRGRPSVSENIGSRLRNVTERMRSTSRSRAKSPPTVEDAPRMPAPYESIPTPGQQHVYPPRRGSLSRGKSPIAPPDYHHEFPPPPPPPPPPPMPGMSGGGGFGMMEQVVPPEALAAHHSHHQKTNSYGGGYRNPKEIRANMPPDHLQLGVEPASAGMI